MPLYIVAYVYTDLLDYSGPLAGLRALFGWQGPPTTGSRPFAPRGAPPGCWRWCLPYVYLLARALLEQSVSLIHQPSARLHPLAGFRP